VYFNCLASKDLKYTALGSSKASVVLQRQACLCEVDFRSRDLASNVMLASKGDDEDWLELLCLWCISTAWHLKT